MKILSFVLVLTLSACGGHSIHSPVHADGEVQWSKLSAPGPGGVASVVEPGEPGKRHVADCITWSVASTDEIPGPPPKRFLSDGRFVSTPLQLELFDGIPGPGDHPVWTIETSLPAVAGSTQHETFCGLGRIGTTGEAMTLQFGYGAPNVYQSLALNGHDIQGD